MMGLIGCRRGGGWGGMAMGKWDHRITCVYHSSNARPLGRELLMSLCSRVTFVLL